MIVLPYYLATQVESKKTCEGQSEVNRTGDLYWNAGCWTLILVKEVVQAERGFEPRVRGSTKVDRSNGVTGRKKPQARKGH